MNGELDVLRSKLEERSADIAEIRECLHDIQERVRVIELVVTELKATLRVAARGAAGLGTLAGAIAAAAVTYLLGSL